MDTGWGAREDAPRTPGGDPPPVVRSARRALASPSSSPSRRSAPGRPSPGPRRPRRSTAPRARSRPRPATVRRDRSRPHLPIGTRASPAPRAPGRTSHAGGNSARSRAERDVALAATWHLDPASSPRRDGQRRHGRGAQALAAVDARVGRRGRLRARTHRGRRRRRERRTAREGSHGPRRPSYGPPPRSTAPTRPARLGHRPSRTRDPDGRAQPRALRRRRRRPRPRRHRARGDGAPYSLAVQAADPGAAAAGDRGRGRGPPRPRDAGRRPQALARATAARDQVLTDVRTARRLLGGFGARRPRGAGPGAAVSSAPSVPVAPGTLRRPAQLGPPQPPLGQVHTGDDLSTACGTPVLAVNDGTV